ncbi:helix-turn-helix domain-containing protein [Rhizobium deserti]|uniref:Helix-turn-helix domain-containing protein n=1 Tax=Rhizobium deserti TaxID=2547961 RepID=A0A4R5UAV6_9HYPH|nr:helix-turn-helix domain-containing protein [Rhizobium deserti]TDK32173.1 helix-turn-helix domain-containing protein [Rhizobium deserti]
MPTPPERPGPSLQLAARLSPQMEARLFRGSLSASEWTFRGHRNRIFLLSSGSGHVRLGRRETELTGPAMIWSPTGEAGSVIFDAGSEGAALAVPDETLGSAMPTGAVFAQVREAIARPILGRRLASPDTRRMVGTVATIEQELKADQPGAQEVIRHHLALLLLAIWRLADPLADQVQPSPRAVVRGFVHLVELHVRDHWTIPQYASTLGVTADRLNTAVRRATGRTPVEVIHSRLMTEAAVLLDQSALQIAEIAEALGFKDAAYFSRFFKRTAGQSPRDYRQNVSQKRIVGDGNYAAWP